MGVKIFMKNNLIITIARQFGSGGRYIGKLLAEELQIPFFDRELIDIISEKSGISKQVVESVDEKANKFFYSLMFAGGTDSMYDLSMNDKIFVMQADIIKKLADEGPCVFVGRCADYLLNDSYEVLKLFIYQSMAGKKERSINYYNVPEEKAENTIIKNDKRRAAYYNYYTNLKWGNPENYDLCINSDMGIESAVKLIKSYIDIYYAKKV
jgi:cytidylate kinase